MWHSSVRMRWKQIQVRENRHVHLLCIKSLSTLTKKISVNAHDISHIRITAYDHFHSSRVIWMKIKVWSRQNQLVTFNIRHTSAQYKSQYQSAALHTFWAFPNLSTGYSVFFCDVNSDKSEWSVPCSFVSVFLCL